MPERDVVGVLEHLEHVVAGSTQQLLEGDLERVGTRPAQPGTDHAQRHQLTLTVRSRRQPGVH